MICPITSNGAFALKWLKVDARSPPLGYLNDLITKQVVKDPVRFPLIRNMWDLLLTGEHTPNAIVTIATDEWGLTTRQFKHVGGGPVAYSTVYSIFGNPFYYGKFLWNGELVDGAHEPMITFNEFERAQYLMGRRTQPRPKQKFFAYTGLINCGECGAAVTAENKVNRYGSKYTYYHCTKRKRGTYCLTTGR
ncbi:MAG: recombinase zinc beta ribbon domain-containing protein [bacterium]|nr:recombinase zinc beta ribbon domain-containing protein [bacterium]